MKAENHKPFKQNQNKILGDFFPNFICRISGFPVQVTEELHSEYCEKQIKKIFTIEKGLTNNREEPSQILYDLIGCEKDQERRNRFLKLRRDMFNFRYPDPSVVKEALVILPNNLSRKLQVSLELIREYHNSLKNIRNKFDGEIKILRNKLRKNLQDTDFQMGVQLSSIHLYNAMKKYLSTDIANFKGRLDKVERSLLKYFTRMSMKATPFARFCTIIPGYFVNEAQNKSLYQFNGIIRSKKGKVRLNKMLYGIIWKHITENQKIKQHLFVCLNSSITRDNNDSIIFLDVINAVESFRRLEDNPTISFILNMLKEGNLYTYKELTELILERSKKSTTKSKIEAYLNRLIEIGFLRLTAKIPRQEINWDVKLCAHLESCAEEAALDIVRLLKYQRKKLDRFRLSNKPEKRQILINNIRSRISNFVKKYNLDFTIIDPLFEDTTAPVDITISRSKCIEKIECDLTMYLTFIRSISKRRRKLANMRYFFDSFYGSKVSTVSLLKFYEDYYRHHYKDHLNHIKNSKNGKKLGDKEYDTSNPFGLDFISSILKAEKNFKELIAEKWTSSVDKDIQISVEDLNNIMKQIPNFPVLCKWSNSIFGELVHSQKNKEARFLLLGGGYLVGFGKMFSRFLYLFPKDFEKKVRDNNESLMEGTLAELNDDANFNANLHPPLVSKEISYPPGGKRAGQKEISINDIEVIKNPSNKHSLRLRHKISKKIIFPFDTGFLRNKNRPPLYKLLADFSPVSNYFPELPNLPSNINRSHQDTNPKILKRPRIVFNDRIVISRKSWFVPDSLYPVQGKQEDITDFFIKVTRWRKKWNIPFEGYIRFLRKKSSDASPVGRESEEESEKIKYINWENYRKPQYINFNSPLLVDIFEQSRPQVTNYIAVLEECYPTKDMRLSYNKNSYATEFIMQMDFSRKNSLPNL